MVPLQVAFSTPSFPCFVVPAMTANVPREIAEIRAIALGMDDIPFKSVSQFRVVKISM